MADGGNVGLLAAIGSAIAAAVGSVIAVITFWMRLSDRITIADQKAEKAMQKAEIAMQEAAEAKNEVATLREALEEMLRVFNDRMDRRSREEGEGLAAIRQHVTELAFFVRDTYVKEKDFLSAVKDIREDLREIKIALSQK